MRRVADGTPNAVFPTAPTRIPEAEPRTAFSTPASTPFAPLLAGLKRTVRTTLTTAVALLTLAQGLNPAVAAAQTGAARVTTDGAPITWVAERPGPSLTRYQDAKSTLAALDAAQSEQSEARFAVNSSTAWLPPITKELAEARAALERWTSPDTTGLEKWDADLVIEDAQRERDGLAAEVTRMEALVAAHPAEHATKVARLEAANDRVAALEALLAPIGDEAFRALEALGLRPSPEWSGAYKIGIAAIVEKWAEKSGRAVSDLAPYERAWLKTFGAMSPETIDARIASFDTWPTAMLGDVVALSIAPGWSDEGAARAERVAAALEYTPNAIDVAALGRWDDVEVDRMIARAAALEAVGLEWTDGLRTSLYPTGPGAMTDFTVLLGLRTEQDTVRFWIDPPASFSARFADISFDQLVAGAKAWVAAGHRLTVDALPAVAIQASGGPRAERLNAILARVELGTNPDAAKSLANLARIEKLDDAAFARVDEVAARFGRKLTLPELASVCDGWLKHPERDDVPSAAAIANAQKNDANASLDDVYVWSVAKPQTRDALIASLTTRLEGREHASRSDRAAEYSERFVDQIDRLSTSDLMRIDALLGALEDASVRGAVLDQIAADVANTSSELGGMFVVEGGAPRFVPLAPSAESSNNEFSFPSDVNRLATLASAHLHAVGHTDGTNAGPSSAYGGREADRGVARETGVAEIVIADLGDGRFGVDYYNPEGAVVDLGVFTR